MERKWQITIIMILAAVLVGLLWLCVALDSVVLPLIERAEATTTASPTPETEPAAPGDSTGEVTSPADILPEPDAPAESDTRPEASTADTTAPTQAPDTTPPPSTEPDGGGEPGEVEDFIGWA